MDWVVQLVVLQNCRSNLWKSKSTVIVALPVFKLWIQIFFKGNQNVFGYYSSACKDPWYSLTRYSWIRFEMWSINWCCLWAFCPLNCMWCSPIICPNDAENIIGYMVPNLALSCIFVTIVLQLQIFFYWIMYTLYCKCAQQCCKYCVFVQKRTTRLLDLHIKAQYRYICP